MTRTTFIKGFVLLMIDIVFIWFYVDHVDPSPSVSIAIIYLVPFVFLLNLVISGLLFVFKLKQYSRLFLINSIIASFLMYFLFGKGIDRHQGRIFESWKFEQSDTIFTITRWKTTNRFSMDYSLYPGTSMGFLNGDCILSDDVWFLKSDSIEMRIEKNNLIGFRLPCDTIKIKKL